MIKEATLDDLDNPSIYSMGLTFFAEAKLPGEFNPALFRKNIQHLVANNCGVVFLLIEQGSVTGAIGGLTHPDICDNSTVAQELFWFVNPTNRGKLGAVRLYEAFEKWARKRGASRLYMAAVCNDYLGALRKFYEKRGFVPKDIIFFKPL
jgi:GNAT superfamily N-acetyltransferase